MVLSFGLVVLTYEEREAGEVDAYIRGQIVTAAISALDRDLAGQDPGDGGGKTKSLLDAGSLYFPK